MRTNLRIGRQSVRAILCPLRDINILSVKKSMLKARHYFQILNAIVEFILIFMMNNLRLFQSSTEIVFHDDAMFKPVSSFRHANESISGGGYGISTLPAWVERFCSRFRHAHSRNAAEFVSHRRVIISETHKIHNTVASVATTIFTF